MGDIDKKSLTERDICTKFIHPALESAGWDLMRQIREQFYFTDGQVLVKGKTVNRGEVQSRCGNVTCTNHVTILLVADS